MGELFRERLERLAQNSDLVQEVRVRGMMIGVELSAEGAPVVQSCLERKLLLNCTQATVIRLLPALNVTADQVNEGIDILTEALESYDA